MTLQSLWKRGADFLGCQHAIMGGAMSWVSEHNLVAALGNAGAFGVIACGAMPPELLAKEIDATRALSDKPFGVNLIIMHPKLDELIEVCRSKNVSHVVLAGGIPRTTTVQAIKAYGAKVICFAPSHMIGRKLVRNGADALVIEGTEAGGHIGPVSTSVLAQEILPEIREVPVFVAGGIGRGEAIATYLQMGASGVQLGTRFVCASESIAHDKFKQLFIRSQARDARGSVSLAVGKVVSCRLLTQQHQQKRLLGMEAVFSLIEHHRVGRFHRGVGGLFAALGGQAVHEYSPWKGLRH